MTNLFNQKSLDVTNYQSLSDADISDFQNNILARWQSACENSCGIENEIQHQHNFLQDFFVKILGYQGETGNQHNTLWWESGTNDGRRPDGILGFNLQSYQNQDINTSNIKAGDIRVVIELKASNVNLDKNQNRKGLAITPIEQGFLYAPKVGGKCEWVIVSNFAEIRLYKASDSSKYHSFFIAELATNTNKLKEFHFLLAKDRLFTKQHQQSPVHKIIIDREEEKERIQEDFYNLYKHNRTRLKQHLIEVNHLQSRKGFCLYASDKLLRRIIFIVFCQERGLIPHNTLSKFVKEQVYGSKYNHLKDIFRSLNIGNNKSNPQVPAFNGGLFKEDKFLDELCIADEEIDKLLFVIDYAFRSDLDVEILGHIFEKSISDLQNEAQEDINFATTEKNEQEKFGVYYTPSYVTKYIVSQTIGKWLNDKKTQIATIFQEGSAEFLEEYKKALLSIRVLDPACGSGAFLVEVFDFLTNEARKLGINNHHQFILQNNIYGVDINPNSVEITKLSLWLKTAHHKEKLLNLNDNIKIGNSLIEDENIAGRYDEYEGKVIYELTGTANDMIGDIYKERQANIFSKSLAFDWQKEFNFKFDVIIGNPPYIKEDKHREIFEPLNPANKKYKSTKHSPQQNKPPFASQYYQGKMDFWQFFACLGLDLLNKNCYLSYIAPNSWLTNHGASKTRNKILQEATLISYVDFNDNKVFKTADIQTMIFCLQKTPTATHLVEYCKLNNTTEKLFAQKQVAISESLTKSTFEKIELATADLLDKTIHFVSDNLKPLFDKLEKVGSYRLKKDDIFSTIDYSQDIVNKKSKKILGKNFKIGDGIFSITTAEKDALNLTTQELEIIKPEYTTKEIDRYFANNKNTRWTIYTNSSFKKPNKINNYPNIKKHLDKFKKIITSMNKPYGLHCARKETIFLGKKILVVRKSTLRPCFSYIDFDSYVDRTFNIIKPNDINLKYLTGVLNSKLVAFYLKNKGKMQGSNYQLDMQPICKIPIAIASQKQQIEIIEKVELLMQINGKIDVINTQFFELLTGEFATININKQLTRWSELSWGEFLQAITLQKIFLNAKQEEKWLARLKEKQAEVKKLQLTFNQTDAEIDRIVYALYQLSEEEIAVIENHSKD